jgi:hypothetical protein
MSCVAQQSVSLLRVPSFASVHIGIEPGRTSLRLEASVFALFRRDKSARQGPALQNIEHSTLNLQPSTMKTGGKLCPTLSEVITNELQISLASAEFGVPFNGTL